MNNNFMQCDRPWLKSYDSGMPPALSYPDCSLPTLLHASAKKFPDRTAIIFLGNKLDYKELSSQVNLFASALLSIGVKPGDRVALLLPNSPQFVICYYGVMQAGAVVVPINPLYVPREIRSILADSGAKVLIGLEETHQKILSSLSQTKVEKLVLTNLKDYMPFIKGITYSLSKHNNDMQTDAVPEKAVKTYKYKELISSVAFVAGLHSTRPSSSKQIALLQYTGGIDGIAKGAVLSHGNLVANTLQSRALVHFQKEGEEIYLSMLPYFHGYGMTTMLNLPVYIGATIIIEPRFKTENLFKLVKHHKPTAFCGVPPIYASIVESALIEKADLKCLNVCISGAASLDPQLLDGIERLIDGPVIEGYGLSEASPVTHANPAFGKRKPNSIGLPFPDVEAMIVDRETGQRKLSLNESGELLVKGPQVMEGYWQRPSETSNVLIDGWLHTGDIAYIDEEGYFFLTGLKKNVIITGGFNVFPSEVEEILRKHPKIQEVTVVGEKGKYGQESVKAIIKSVNNSELDTRGVTDFCQGKMAKYKIPKIIEFKK